MARDSRASQAPNILAGLLLALVLAGAGTYISLRERPTPSPYSPHEAGRGAADVTTGGRPDPNEDVPPPVVAEDASPALKSPRSHDSSGDLLPPGAVLRLGTTRLRHGNAVRALAFSADGQTLWSGGTDKIVSLWEVGTGRELQRRPNWAPVTALTLLPDGRTMVSSGGQDAAFLFRDLAGRPFLRLLAGRGVTTSSDSFVHPFAVSPDGKRVATMGPDGSIQVWDAVTGEPLRQVKCSEMGELRPPLEGDPQGGAAPPPPEPDFLFFADDVRLVSISSDGDHRLWNAAKGASITDWQKMEGAPIPFQVAVLSPDGRLLAIANSNVISLRDPVTGREVARLDRGAPNGLAFSADGHRLAAFQGSPAIHIWDLESRRRVTEIAVPWGTPPCSIALSPDGALVAGGTYEGMIRLWDAKTGAERTRHGHAASVISTAFSPDGSTILTGGEDGIREWNAGTGEERAERRIGGESAVRARFLPGGERVLFTGNGRFRVVETKSRTEVCSGAIVAGSRWSWTPPAVSTAGDRIAALEIAEGGPGESPPMIGIWDLTNGGKICSLPAPPGGITSLAFSPGDRTLAATHITPFVDSKSERVQTLFGWDPATGRERFHVRIPSHFAYQFTAAYSPRGTLTLLGGSSEARSLPLGEHGVAAILNCVPGFPGQSQYSPDGSLFASTCWRDNHRVDISGGGPEGRGVTFRDLRGYVTAIGFSPDGRLLATGQSDGTVLLWDVRHPGTPERAPRPPPTALPERDDSRPPRGYMSFDGHLRGRGVLTTRTPEGSAVARFVPGRIGQALRIEGGREARPLEFAEGESLHLGSAFTVEFWYRTEEGPPWKEKDHLQFLRSDLFSFDVRDEAHALLFYHFWNYQTGEGGGHGQFTVDDRARPGEWRHVAMTSDGSNGPESLVLYVNGKRTKATGTGSALPDHLGPLAIGPWGRADGTPHAAAIDEFAVYDYARSPGQIVSDAGLVEDPAQRTVERPPAFPLPPASPEAESPEEIAEWIPLPDDLSGMIRVEHREGFTVYRFDGDLTNTQTMSVALADGAVWIATSRGLIRHAEKAGTWSLFGTRAGLPAERVDEMAELRGDLIVDLSEPTSPGFTVGRGMWRFSPARRACDRIGDAAAWDSGIVGDRVWTEVDGDVIANDPGGAVPGRYTMEKSGILHPSVSAVVGAGDAVWFASHGDYVKETKDFTGGGVSRFDLGTRTWSGFTERDGLARSYCSDLAADVREVWVAHWDTERGLSLFDTATQKWSVVLKSANGVWVGGPRVALAEDAVWVGQQGAMVRLDRATREAKVWREKDGLPGYLVSGLAVAPDAVWAAVYAYGNGGVRSAGVVRVPRK